MYGLVELWQHTDRTQRSICEEHGIKPHVFSYWRSKYEKEKGGASKTQRGTKQSSGSNFISLELRGEADSPQGCFAEIRYKDGTVLRLSQPVDMDSLKNLLPV